MLLAQEQTRQPLNNLQDSINFWINKVITSRDEILDENRQSELEKAILLQVIYFTLSKLNDLIRHHHKLALAVIQQQGQIQTERTFKELIQLIHLSKIAFEKASHLHKTYSDDANKYRTIAIVALYFLKAISIALLVGGITLAITSLLITIPTMPILYSFVALLGAGLISGAIGYNSIKYSNYLNPKEMNSSSNAFYNDVLYLRPQSNTDELNFLNSRLYVTSEDSTNLEFIEQKSSQDLTNIQVESQIQYSVTKCEPLGKATIDYRVYNVLRTKKLEINMQEELTSEKIQEAILNDLLDKSYAFNCRFFSNAIKKILPTAHAQSDLTQPTQNEVENFIETVGLN